jgi:hypothetical protein
MSYTNAFEHLHRLSYEIDLHVTIQYKRVAIYIGRVMMADTSTPRTIGARPNLDSPITNDMPWVEELAGHKEEMLEHFVNISDREWGLIYARMLDHANATKGSPVWHRKRMGMIHQLDTLRAFNN